MAGVREGGKWAEHLIVSMSMCACACNAYWSFAKDERNKRIEREKKTISNMKVWMGWPYVCDIVTVSYTSIYLCNVPLLYLLFRFRFNFDYFTKLCRTELMGDQNEHICNSIELRTCWCCTNAHYYYWLSLREMVQYCIDFSNRKWFSAVWLLLDSVVASRRYFSHGRAIIFVFFFFFTLFWLLAIRWTWQSKKTETKWNKIQ